MHRMKMPKRRLRSRNHQLLAISERKAPFPAAEVRRTAITATKLSATEVALAPRIKANERGRLIMQGKKTHEQTLRTLERKSDLPNGRRSRAEIEKSHGADRTKNPDRKARQCEFPVSRGGMNEESRDHNKHNDPGQSGHKPQQPSPAQEKN